MRPTACMSPMRRWKRIQMIGERFSWNAPGLLLYLDEGPVLLPILLAELFGAIDDDIAFVVGRDGITEQRRLGRALFDHAFGSEMTLVAGAVVARFIHLHGAVPVCAPRGDRIDLAIFADDQSLIRLGCKLIVNLVVLVIRQRSDIERSGSGRGTALSQCFPAARQRARTRHRR